MGAKKNREERSFHLPVLQVPQLVFQKNGRSSSLLEDGRGFILQISNSSRDTAPKSPTWPENESIRQREERGSWNKVWSGDLVSLDPFRSSSRSSHSLRLSPHKESPAVKGEAYGQTWSISSETLWEIVAKSRDEF